MKNVIIALLIVAVVFACSEQELPSPTDVRLNHALDGLSPTGDLSWFILPDATDYEKIPQDAANPLTAAKVALGKMLFFETGLGQDALHEEGRGTYSCATCHVPRSGFMPGRAQGIADGGLGFGFKGESREVDADYGEGELDVQGARPLSLLNVAYVTNTTWSGKFGAGDVNEGTEQVWADEAATEINHLGMSGLESQNIEGLALHRMRVDKEIVEQLGYREMFDEAFPEVKQNRYSAQTASFAISAYLRCLLTTEAPFQRWLKGETGAMSEIEKEGAVLFFGKAGCYRCHTGPALNSMTFHALGVKDLYQHPDAVQTDEHDKRNLGRGGFTLEEEDMYKFKVPGIYNMAQTPFYFHGSSHSSLEEVVEYFNAGVPENPNVPEAQISPSFHPLQLTTTEKEALVKFLRYSLLDPDLDRYVPRSLPSGNCFPNGDPISTADLGCE